MTAVFEIGAFRLDPESRTLTRLGAVEALGPRAVALLAVLVRNARTPVTKKALIAAAWPGLVVEEANLSVQMSSIRRVLAQVPGGDRWVETLARRGYRFIGPVTELQGGRPQQVSGPHDNLPQRLASFVGRQRELVEVKRLLAKNRLLTLTGAGGIGKTRLAQQLAAEVKDAYRDGIWFIDLAPLGDPALVPNAVAQCLGVRQSPERPVIETLARHVTAQRLLLIFDNCEHVLDASARLAEAMLRAGAGPTIVATSQEPLRIDGEQIYRLPTLSLPDSADDVEAMRQSDAVLLFVDRAQHQQHDFELTPALASPVAQLCIRLDGIPLALELAAALVHAYPIHEINARLYDRFNLLTDGSRTALPRQRTLRATLDWSYSLLPQAERTILRRTSLFPGGFTPGAVAAVAADETIPERELHDLLARLTARSLIVADGNAADPRYRLLETTRAYGLERLVEAGETAVIRRRHAHYVCALFERAVDDWARIPEATWRMRYEPEIDNVRAALEWSLGVDGNPAMAVALAGASGPVWTALSLFGEGIERLEAASAYIRPDTPVRDEARLWLWLASLLEPAMPARTLHAYERAVALYRKAGDPEGRALASVWLARTRVTLGELESAAALLAETRPVLERLQLPRILGMHAANAAYLAMMSDDSQAAQAHYEEALTQFRAAGYEFGMIACLGNLANSYWAAGDLRAAEAAFRESTAMWRASRPGRKDALGYSLMNVAGVLTEIGKLQEALEAAREGLPMLSDIGGAWRLMDHLALRAALAGKFANAAQLGGYVSAMFDAKNAERETNEARAHGRLRNYLHERLDPASIERHFAAGATMHHDEACQIALA